MNRKTVLASALTLLMAGSASFVMAQTSSPNPATPSAAGKDMHRTEMGHQGHQGRPMQRGGYQHQDGGVIGDLRELEQLYMTAGRNKDLTAVYNDVLAKSQDPRVRSYVYHRLARLQARPANVDQAIATMRKSLDESLANEVKMRAEHEKMRAAWQQHRGPGMMTPPPAPAEK